MFLESKRMTDKPESPLPLTLKRWSQRKLAAARHVAVETAVPQAPPMPTPTQRAPEAPSATAPRSPNVALASQNDGVTGLAPGSVPDLPPLESLTFDSDFSAFMRPEVGEATKRAALKKLFSDPSFNVMDGLDIYIGDYTLADPMPAGMLEKLSAVYALVDSPDDKKATDAPAAAGVAATAPCVEAAADSGTAASPSTPAETAATVAPDQAPEQPRRPDERRG